LQAPRQPVVRQSEMRATYLYLLGGLAALLLIATAAASYFNVRTLFTNNAFVTHTHVVIAHLERVLSALKDAETGQRGFLITGREDYLEPYHDAVSRLPAEFQLLKTLTADNPSQQTRIEAIEPRVQSYLAHLEATVARRQRDDAPPTSEALLAGNGKKQMDALRQDIAKMENEENRLIVQRVAESERSLWQTLLVLMLAMGLTLVLLLLTGYLLHIYLAAKNDVSQRVRAEREWLDVTLRSIGDAVIATDVHSRILFLNPVAEVLTGYTLESAKGLHIDEVFRIFNETTRQPAENPVSRVLAEGVVVGLANHTVLIAKDGVERPIDDSAAPIRGREANLLGVVLVFRDVTERRRAEEQVRQSWQELEDFFQNSPVGLHWVGPDGIVLRVNEAELALLGYSREEYVGHHISEFHESPGTIHDILDRLSRRETLSNYEARLRCKDGSIKDVLISSNVLIMEGQFVHSRCFTRDITERKRAENWLRFLADAGNSLGRLVDYESTLQSVARLSVPFFADFCVVDLIVGDNAIRRVAAAHIEPEKETLLRNLFKQWPLDRNSRSIIARVLRSGHAEMANDAPDSVLQDLARDEAHLAIIRSLQPRCLMVVPLVQRNRVHGTITFVHSVSKRRFQPQDLELAHELAGRVTTALESARLYDELREADRRKDEFLAMLAHELRNPLAAIQYANQLSSIPNIERQGIDCSAMISQQLQQLKRLIDDLLDVSRITQNKIELKREVIDVRAVLDRARGVIQPLIEQRKHRLTLESPSSELLVYADGARLEQMIVNLLANAAKYTEEGGHIRLLACREDGKVLIKVRDTGIGLSPEMLSKVFSLFVQVDGSLARSQGGLGIGLTLVKRLAELHGGGIEAASLGLGKGSEFTLWLPVAAQDLPAVGASAARTSEATKALRVLVVEDNVDAANCIALLLKNEGHQVTVCYEGDSAIDTATHYRPDVVLLDLGLPGKDGYQVATGIRREELLAGVRLIAMSGYGQAVDRRRSSEAGFDHHLVKPIDLATLLTIIGSVESPSESASLAESRENGKIQ